MNKIEFWSSITILIFSLLFSIVLCEIIGKELINMLILGFLIWISSEKLYDRKNQKD